LGDQSFNERQRLVQAAIQQARGSSDLYIVELYDDRAIYECYGDGSDAGKSYEVPYSIAADETVTLGDRKEVVRETTYRAVKFVKGSDVEIEGLAIPFGGPVAGKDLDGEDFGADTDLALDWFPHGRPMIYHHGLDAAMKAVVQGRQVEHEIIDEGVWARGQLDKSAKYHSTVAKLVGAGKLFFSSGSMPHLVETDKTGHIKRWPWVELSLTPTPANPLATVHAVKSTDLIERLTALDLAVPAELIASALKALDGFSSDDDALPDGAKFADLIDRLSVEGPAWVKARLDWHAKSGRVLSAVTRDRLVARPSDLRQLADSLDALLATGSSKSIDPALVHASNLATSRALGLDI
jgi:hypothetical protein